MTERPCTVEGLVVRPTCLRALSHVQRYVSYAQISCVWSLHQVAVRVTSRTNECYECGNSETCRPLGVSFDALSTGVQLEKDKAFSHKRYTKAHSVPCVSL